MPPRHIDTTAARAAFEAAVANHDQAFGTFFLARLFGFEISYEADRCVVAFEVGDYMFNPQGSLHGGIIALAMDVSMGHLLARSGTPGVTLEMKTQFMQPIRTGRVRASGRALRRGASIWFTESQLTDAAGDVAAYATATWKLLRKDG